MKLSIISVALALAASALSAPTGAKIQLQIQSLEEQIIVVENDIVQSNSMLMADYKAGASMMGMLSKKLSGPQPCSMSTATAAKTSNQALMALQMAEASLIQLRSDLLDPSNMVAKGDFNDDICEAQGYYMSISKFIGA